MNLQAILLCAGLAFSTNDADEAAKLQGVWEVSQAEFHGTKIAKSALAGSKFEIDGEKFVAVVGVVVHKGHYKIDPKANPKTIDLTATEGPNAGKTSKAIYEIEGGVLKLCNAMKPEGERPTAFATKSGDGLSLQTLKKKGDN